jgi:3-oxoacyl-[acyl-carrier protein] reductase
MIMRKVALVTGGSRGIGLGIARALARDGFALAINGVRPLSAVTEVISELSGAGVEVIYCQGDLGSTNGRRNIIQKVRDHYGALNVLVNNAGIAPRERRDILEATEESFDEVLSTNLKGNYFLTQEAANWMIAQKKGNESFHGCIINVSSISATVASVNRGDYCISKAGISMATQLFAVRLGEFDIPVYEVRPGVISTDMTSGVREKYDKMIEQGLCVTRRWGTPEDVGVVVGALASGRFPYSTGQVIMVDGGLTLPRL